MATQILKRFNHGRTDDTVRSHLITSLARHHAHVSEARREDLTKVLIKALGKRSREPTTYVRAVRWALVGCATPTKTRWIASCVRA